MQRQALYRCWLLLSEEVVHVVTAERADALLAKHRRVRRAARDLGQYAVRASLPMDKLGVDTLLPRQAVAPVVSKCWAVTTSIRWRRNRHDSIRR